MTEQCSEYLSVLHCNKFDEYINIYAWKNDSFQYFYLRLFKVQWRNILYLNGGSKWKKNKRWEERKKKPIWQLPLFGNCFNGVKSDRIFTFTWK